MSVALGLKSHLETRDIFAGLDGKDAAELFFGIVEIKDEVQQAVAYNV
jgi:hypothetical protein